MKIKKLKIVDNEKIGNIELDFTKNGIIQDTIIFAGNNGSGKTTILEEMVLLVEIDHAIHLDRKKGYVSAELVLSEKEVEKIKTNINEAKYGNISELDKLTNEIEFKIDFKEPQSSYDRLKIYTYNGTDKEELNSYNILVNGKFEKIISSFYSAANIDYIFNDISNITSIDIDKSYGNSIKSSSNTGNQIKQTFIDIYNFDAQDFQEWANENIGKTIDEEKMYTRLKRFKNAFKYIMKDLEFDRIVSKDNKIDVMFKRNGKRINIDDLSTGEKQIIIRGGFLLRFLKILQGSIILIDEPELSLHPEWQNKILQFYKKLFINENGEQVSQIFLATHSPFIINNSSRYNDKVIVLNRNSVNGNIEVVKNPTYYDCNNSIYIHDAFDINEFDKDKNILFTEGETDEKYLRKAIEIFFNNSVSFNVEWIGKRIGEKQIINTGCTALNNLLKILEANENLFSKKIGLLYDCDTNKTPISNKKYFTYTLKNMENKTYEIGIENLLTLPDCFEYDRYIKKMETKDKYGATNIIAELDKNKLCEEICSSENVQEYLMEMKNVIQEVEKLMNNDNT